MALIVAFVNKSELAPVSDYEATVYVNNRVIAGPFMVKGHKREAGWLKLVEQFVEEQFLLRNKPKYEVAGAGGKQTQVKKKGREKC